MLAYGKFRSDNNLQAQTKDNKLAKTERANVNHCKPILRNKMNSQFIK